MWNNIDVAHNYYGMKPYNKLQLKYAKMRVLGLVLAHTLKQLRK